jgi:hypothetical protein
VFRLADLLGDQRNLLGFPVFHGISLPWQLPLAPRLADHAAKRQTAYPAHIAHPAKGLVQAATRRAANTERPTLGRQHWACNTGPATPGLQHRAANTGGK